MLFQIKNHMNLQLFAEGEAGAAAATAVVSGGAEAAAPVTAGEGAEAENAGQVDAQGDDPAQQRIERQQAFEARIKGEDKEFFDERVQKIISQRFKSQKGLEKQLKDQSAVLGRLAHRYGVQGNDMDALMQAMEADDSYYDGLADKLGLADREQAREFDRLQFENARFKSQQEASEREANRQRILGGWMREAEEAKRFYPGFDLDDESSNPETGKQFLDMLSAGVPVKAAYEALHIGDILGGAMHMTAQKIREKTVNDIKARGMRPSENGSSGSAVAVQKKSVAQMTRREREDLERRALRGERIEL